jgi:predicted CoA-binding protein
MAELTRDDDLRAALARARVVAVLGAHQERTRAAHYVPDYLHRQGYRILPVNPHLPGAQLWSEPVRSSLLELREPVDMINVFRRSSEVPAHVEEILHMRPLPKLVWLQLGIRNDAAVRRLLDAGIDVVQDRCSMVDHRRLCLSRPPAAHA